MKKLSKKFLSFLCILALTITFIPISNIKPVLAQEISEETKAPDILYHVHVQNDGNQAEVKNGASAGTTGEAKRLEAIWIHLGNSAFNGSVAYRTHIQNIGWENGWKTDGQMSGTTGEALRLEAIQIKLTGDIAQHFDIYYRVHAQNFGWLGWAKNGESAGTAGCSYRLEAIEIQLVKKGNAAPGDTANAFRIAAISYSAHVQNIGWQNNSFDGSSAGAAEKGLRLESIRISLPEQKYSGSVQYRTHIQNIGWENNWKENGQASGTTGRALRLEAIQIRLTGDMEAHYDVYYRVYVQNIGWLSWVKNGDTSGSSGYSLRLEGIQIILVDKNGSAPSNSLNGCNTNVSTGYVQNRNHTWASLSQLGINYDDEVNQKVDNELARMELWMQLYNGYFGKGTDITTAGNYEKACDILTYVGNNFSYGEGYNVSNMIDNRQGTCFGYSDLVYCLARKVGLTNTSLTVAGRNVDHDGHTYGSQHRTAVSYFDGKYYDLDGNLALYNAYFYGWCEPEEISASYANYLLGNSDSYTSIN